MALLFLTIELVHNVVTELNIRISAFLIAIETEFLKNEIWTCLNIFSFLFNGKCKVFCIKLNLLDKNYTCSWVERVITNGRRKDK